MEWNRRSQFRGSSIGGYVETLLSYTDLLDQVRGCA